MGCLGKIVGGVIGFWTIGPLGALIGCYLGHCFDSIGDFKENKDDKRQAAFISCFFGCLAKIAKADGRINEQEIEMVEKIMVEMRFNASEKERLREVFRKAKNDHFQASDYLKQFSVLIHYDPEISQLLIYSLIKVALADGNISSEELKILYQAERFLEMPVGLVNAILSQMTGGRFYGQNDQSRVFAATSENELENAYRILGVKATDDDATIKKIYRQKCLENHPDRLQHKGLPKEFIESAKEQMILLNQSYDKICRYRGIK